MALSVDELQQELTPAEVESALYNIQTALGLPTTSWLPGSVVRLINKAVAYLGAGFTRLVVTLNKSAFEDTAEEAWLDRRVVDTRGQDVERIPATFARGNIEIDNAGGGIFDFAAGDFVVKNTTANKTYASTGAIHVGASQQNVVAEVQALEVGSPSTAAPGQINALVTTAIGLSVSNPAALVGTDKESDDDYRTRAKESSGRLSPNGPRDAYAYFAKSTKRADGTTIAVNRVKVSSSGVPVTVRVASPSGVVAGDKDTPATDVYLIQQNLETNVVPNGISVETYSATAHSVAVTATLYVRKEIGLTAAQIEASAQAKLVELFKSPTLAPIGGTVISPDPQGYLFRNLIIGQIEALAISTVPNAASYVIKSDVSLPAADVAIGATEVPTAGTLAITAVLV